MNMSKEKIIAPILLQNRVAEASRVGNLQERLVVASHGWQSKGTDGSTGVSCLVSSCLFRALSLTIYLPIHPGIDLYIFLSSYLSF